MSVIRQFPPAAFLLQLSPHIAVCCCLGIGKGKQNISKKKIKRLPILQLKPEVIV